MRNWVESVVAALVTAVLILGARCALEVKTSPLVPATVGVRLR